MLASVEKWAKLQFDTKIMTIAVVSVSECDPHHRAFLPSESRIVLQRRSSMLRAVVVATVLALSSAAALAAEAGRVVFVVGKAEVGARAAVVDAAVQEGDQLSTGADGYIYMKTVDQGFLILRPNSRARIAAYHVDAA